MRELIAMSALFLAFVVELGLVGVRALHIQQQGHRMSGIGQRHDGFVQFAAEGRGMFLSCHGPQLIDPVPDRRQARIIHRSELHPARARNQAPEVPVLPRKAPIERQAA